MLNLDIVVAYLLSPSFNWKLDILKAHFFKEEAYVISKIRVGGQGYVDKLSWFYTKNEVFLVKLAYWLARSTTNLVVGGSDSGNSFCWKKTMWSLNVQNKIKLFI